MADELDAAVRALAAGQLVVYPTDTLLGLGARADDPRAVDRLLSAKDRPSGMPVSIAVSSMEELEELVDWDRPERGIARRLLPGPVTLIVRASVRARRTLAAPIVAPDGSVGIRIPDHAAARDLARRAGPITATSANRHGLPPCRTVAAARQSFGDRVAVYVRAGPPPPGRASMLVDLRGSSPRFVPRP